MKQKSYQNNGSNIPFIKIVVVGESHVGKSNMISRFVYSKFFIGGPTTVGSQIDSKRITIFKQSNNKAQQQMDVNLYIWDTAGQQRYRSLNKIFYNGALGALVLFDLGQKSTFLKLNKWIEEIRSCTSQNIVLLLIGNKCDLKQQVVTVQQATQYARKEGMGYMETSAALNINIDKAFHTLAQKIMKIYYKNNLFQISHQPVQFDKNKKNGKNSKPNNDKSQIKQKEKKEIKLNSKKDKSTTQKKKCCN